MEDRLSRLFGRLTMPSEKLTLPGASEALPGRVETMPVAGKHFVLGTDIQPPFPEGLEKIVLGLGCFWGAEKCFWTIDGVHTTAVGYAAGHTPNPTYEEVCSGRTGHNEVVLVVYDPAKASLDHLLHTFWEGHDPTQGMRQGNDMGTQYRSACYCLNESDMEVVKASLKLYQEVLLSSGFGNITTGIKLEEKYFLAEEYHQQYLDKNPNGYCGIGGTNCSFPN